MESCHCKTCAPWLWPSFQSQNFEMLLSLKWWKLVQNALHNFCRCWYLPSNDVIAKILLRDVILSYFFEDNKFNVNISEMVRAIANCMGQLFWILIFAIEGQDCKNFIWWPWSTLKVKIWNINISEMVSAGTKMHAKTIKYWYLPLWML